ncbi:MAG: hypothetical protein K2I23_04035 [Clostridia bacterium]|nr:hypothetical protein [Clostridia bacterium]
MAKEKIYGNLEYCYNGLPIIRGYCSYKKLLQYSKPHPSYQRTAEEQHVNEIRAYLESPQIKFMTEVVLSFDCTNVVFDEQYLSLADAMLRNAGSKFFSSNKDLSIAHIGSAKINKIIRFEFNDNKPAFFHRIDGNHRLEALKDYRGDDFQIPFCVILLSSSGNPELRVREKTEMEIFHNINAKVKPLTSIEQYNGLFNLFSVDELLQFGKDLSVTQEYLLTYSQTSLNNLFELLRDLSDTVMRCVKFIMSNSIEISAQELADIFGELNHTYFSDCEKIRHCKDSNALVPYVYYCKTGGGHKNAKLSAFNDWFISNKLYNIEKFDPTSIVKVFDSIYEIRQKQIFVAMPFKPELDFVYQAIRSTVEKLNNKYGIELPTPIRIDKQITGYSYDIVDEILTQIQNAGLLIADLTDQNANVYYEVGYAQGLLQSQLGNAVKVLYLISNPSNPDDPFASAKFDVQHYKMLPYKNIGNGVQELKDALENELKVFYGIQ